MARSASRILFRTAFCYVALVLAAFTNTVFSQGSDTGKALYDQIAAFDLNGGKVDVSNLTVKRDRGIMTFTGTFFLSAPIQGKVTSAVFVGNGTFKADPPANDFERAQLRRLIKADSLVGDFTTAALRFTDDTATLLGTPSSGAATPPAQKIAAETDENILEETGANIPSRVLLSILNQENPGFFFALSTAGNPANFALCLITKIAYPLRRSESTAAKRA